MPTKSKINIFFAAFLPIFLAIFLQFLPLTNTTGFEFSFLLTLPLFISGGLIYFVPSSLKWKVMFSFILLGFVLLISLVSNWLLSPCPISSDLFFYFILSVPAFLNGVLTAGIIASFINRFRVLTLLIIFIIFLSIALIEFYLLPQIYFYNIVFGYFPGTIYDENISIDFTLILYRIITSLAFLIFYLLIKKVTKPNKSIFIIVTFLIISIWFVFLKPYFGFNSTSAIIEENLPQELKTEHFNIYTDAEISFDTTSIKLMHEFYYSEITSALNLTHGTKITSFIFKNRSQKKQLFGSENADVAKPWLEQIYIDESSFTNTLKHELIHVLAKEFGNPPFYVAANINPSLIEGLAMAIENNFDDYDIDYVVSLAEEYNYNVDLKNIFNGFNFFGNLSSLSYLYSGSFMKFLLNHYGVEKIKELYGNGDFDKTYNQSIENLSKEYFLFLSNKQYRFNKEKAKLYFGRQPLIKKICPRLAARIEKRAWNDFQQKEYESALDKFEFIFNSAKNYSSLNGIILTKIRLGLYKNTLNIVEENLNNFSNTSYFYNLVLRAAELSALNSDSVKCKNYLEQLIKLNPSVDYFNAGVLRKDLLESGINKYNEYLLGSDDSKYEQLLNLTESIKDISTVIPELIEYSELNNERKSKFLDIVNEFAELQLLNESDVDTALQLARYFYKNGDYKSAHKFAELALSSNKNSELYPILEEELKLINWSIEKLDK